MTSEQGDNSAGSTAAEVTWQLGRIAQAQKQYDEARWWYEQALAGFKRLGDKRRRANVMYQLGNIAYLQGQYAEARRWYEQADETGLG